MKSLRCESRLSQSNARVIVINARIAGEQSHVNLIEFRMIKIPQLNRAEIAQDDIVVRSANGHFTGLSRDNSVSIAKLGCQLQWGSNARKSIDKAAHFNATI